MSTTPPSDSHGQQYPPGYQPSGNPQGGYQPGYPPPGYPQGGYQPPGNPQGGYQPGYPPPGYPQGGSPPPYPSPGGSAPLGPNGERINDPNKGLAIVGLLLAFCGGGLGLIISIVALVKSRKGGYKNVIAVIGIVIGVIGTLVTIGLTVLFVGIFDKCSELGPGTHVEGGVTYTCGSNF